MTHHLLVVEGAHDAMFIGRLLGARGYVEVRRIDQLIDPWLGLIPRQYPARHDGRLDRIVAYPNVFKIPDQDEWVGVAVAGGESNILETLRTPIEKYDIRAFASIGIIIDADWEVDVRERFRRFHQTLEAWNKEEEANGLKDFPIKLPSSASVIVPGSTRFGIYLFPREGEQGTLENLLLDCASVSLRGLHNKSQALIDSLDAELTIHAETLRKYSKPSGKHKCQVGTIANILNPGASLAVSLQRSEWLNNLALSCQGVKEADKFLGELFGLEVSTIISPSSP